MGRNAGVKKVDFKSIEMSLSGAEYSVPPIYSVWKSNVRTLDTVQHKGGISPVRTSRFCLEIPASEKVLKRRKARSDVKLTLNG